jgi:hypothetical protein
MNATEYITLDFGGYLYGMFFAGGFMMTCYGIVAGIKSVKGIGIPLAITSAMLGYYWWQGEFDSFRSYFIW